MWEEIKANLLAFANTPLATSLFTAFEVGVFALVIFSKTSLGKKALAAMKAKYEVLLGYASDMKKQAEQVAKTADEKINEIKTECDKRLAVMMNYNLALENLIEKMGEHIPNKKVKEDIETFISTKQERLAEIAEYLPNMEEYNALKAQAEHIQAEIEEAKRKATEELTAKIALYDEKCASLDKLLDRAEETLVSAEKPPVGEDYEEATDTDPEKETL